MIFYAIVSRLPDQRLKHFVAPLFRMSYYLPNSFLNIINCIRFLSLGRLSFSQFYSVSDHCLTKFIKFTYTFFFPWRFSRLRNLKLPGVVPAYICTLSIIITEFPFTLRRILLWMVNYMVTLLGFQTDSEPPHTPD